MRLEFGHGPWQKRFNLRMRDSALENCQIELLRLDRKPPPLRLLYNVALCLTLYSVLTRALHFGWRFIDGFLYTIESQLYWLCLTVLDWLKFSEITQVRWLYSKACLLGSDVNRNIHQIYSFSPLDVFLHPRPFHLRPPALSCTAHHRRL